MTIANNSQLLFIYDAKMSNPNGDMDNENRPRMDYDTNTNLVSDVRLKRYLRDYFEKACDLEIFVTENAQDAKDRGKQLKNNEMTHTDLIDVRLFGAVFAKEGGNDHLTGPLQFNWGYSLNPVEINDSSTITSSFAKGEGIGKDFRVKYSVIAFDGGINAYTAKYTLLTDDDIQLLDSAMINAIPFCRTRSKTGQTPRFYLRVESDGNKNILKDLREFISLNYNVDDEFNARSIDDFTLDIKKLIPYLAGQKISLIRYWKDNELEIDGWQDLVDQFDGKMFLVES